MGTFPPPALRTRRADFRHRALQWNHAARTRVPGHNQRAGLRELWHQAQTHAPAGRCVGRPVDALPTATARVVPFAFACADDPGFPLISGVIGRRPLPRACSLSPSLPPEVPSLRRHYPASSVPTDLSATLPAPPDPHGLSVGVCRATGQGFPCCVHSPLPHMPPPLPRRNRSVLASPASRPLAAFPASVMGRLPHHSFRGLLGVHFALWPAWSLNRPWRPFVIGVLQPMSLPPSSAPTATGWGDRCRAGFAPAEEQRLVTAHTEWALFDATPSWADQLDQSGSSHSSTSPAAGDCWGRPTPGRSCTNAPATHRASTSAAGRRRSSPRWRRPCAGRPARRAACPA